MTDPGFNHFVDRDPGAAAIVDPAGGRWSRGRLAALCSRLARALRAHGLVDGDVIAIVAPNCAEYLACCLAATEAGLYIVPVNWHLAEPELAYVLGDADARAVIAHAGLGAERLASLARLVPAALRLSIGRAAEFVELEDFVSPHAARPLARPVKGRVLAYTSATTGRPKAVLYPLDSTERTLGRTIRWHLSLGIELAAGNVHLCSSMLYHAAPLEGALIALQMGHCVVVDDRADPQRLLALIETHRVTTAFIVPTMFARLLRLPAPVRARYSTASLKLVVHAGAACPAPVKRAMIAWWGPILWETYGATEGQGTVADSAEWLRFPGTVGRPIPGSRVMIVDGTGREAPPGAPGKVYFTPYTGERFAYKGDVEKTRSSYRGEFLCVGDIGYLNESGFLFLCGRAAETILCSGMNIYPAEIENALAENPDVADCAVVAMPDAWLGEAPKAFVQPAPGVDAGPALKGEILRHLRERLAPMKLPRRIELVAALPRRANGKLDKRSLPRE